jgi:hypothetical protein
MDSRRPPCEVRAELYAYTQFNGAGDDYDGFGKNAKDTHLGG